VRNDAWICDLQRIRAGKLVWQQFRDYTATTTIAAGKLTLCRLRPHRRQPSVYKIIATTDPIAAVTTAESKALTEVRRLLEASKITDAEMLDVLRTAQLPEAKTAHSLADIPDKTLLLAIESWETVTPLVEELRAQKVAA
jgi:hypothetical protein